VLAQGRLSTPEEFGNVIVRENVARVEKPTAAIAVYQLPGTNAVQTVKGVRKLMAR